MQGDIKDFSYFTHWLLLVDFVKKIPILGTKKKDSEIKSTIVISILKVDETRAFIFSKKFCWYLKLECTLQLKC